MILHVSIITVLLCYTMMFYVIIVVCGRTSCETAYGWWVILGKNVLIKKKNIYIIMGIPPPPFLLHDYLIINQKVANFISAYQKYLQIGCWKHVLFPHLSTGSSVSILTHWGLVTPFGDIDLGQHWLRQWLAAWWHQAITWTNADLSSVRSSGIHLMAIS